MKHCFNLSMITVLFCSYSSALGAYCSASGGGDEYIYQVQVGSINNNATNSNSYTDYSATYSTNMQVGTSYSILIKSAIGSQVGYGYDGDQLGIWVDWNGDEDFADTGETVYTVTAFGTFQTNITPPAGTAAGSKRMRIRLTYTGTLSACGTTEFGEVEDYSINVVSSCPSITIGTGISNWDYPFYTYYHDSRTQSIYLTSEIGSAGQISSLALNVTTIPGQTLNNWTIRMKHTSLPYYWNYNFDSTGWTTVYQANETITSTGWRTFTFPTPFAYNGTSNLMIDFSHNNSSYSSKGTCQYTNTGNMRSATAYSDSKFGDPLNWSESYSPLATFSSSVANIKLTVCPNPPSNTIKLSGYVKTADGVRVRNARVAAQTGQLAYSDALGYYELVLPKPYTGSVNATQTDWTFTGRLYAGLATDAANQDISAVYNVSYGGGAGTASIPYLIYNAAQFNAIGTRPADWNKFFRLMADIDLSAYDGKAGRPSVNRIGYFINYVGGTAFTGTFDGYNRTISNFTFDSNSSQDAVAIFGYTTATATIKNLKVSNPVINSQGFCTGSVLAYGQGGTLTACTVSGGTIRGDSSVGALAGMLNSCTVQDVNCSGATVSGFSSIGGISGYCGSNVTITKSQASCTLAGPIEVGGIIGRSGSSSVTLSKCSSSGSITLYYVSILNRTAGGIVGDNAGLVEQCFSSAVVNGSGASEIGGLAGRNSGAVNDSYSSGPVTGGSSSGGLVGYNSSSGGTINRCYSTGTSTGQGLVGTNSGTVSNSFWDIQASGKSTSAGGTGKTTAEMQTQSTFTNAGWDFDLETANGNNTIWTMKPNSYPKLCWESGIRYGGGTGLVNDPFLIFTPEQFVLIGNSRSDWGKSFKLMADISLSAYTGSAYNSIGRSRYINSGDGPFTGTFDGNFRTISGFSYSNYNCSYVGLFGYISDGTVRNLKVIAPNLSDTGLNDMSYVGAIAGTSEGANISGCSVIGGTIQGKQFVGGIIGLAEHTYIGSCTSSASIQASNNVGGLAGTVYSYSGISNCSATGSVAGTNIVGGLTGASSSSVLKNCFSSGQVVGTTDTGGFSGTTELDEITSCFWDTVSSGKASSAAGTGLATAAMKTLSTFTDAGWDFASETANGRIDFWAIPVAGGYPVLWYEMPTPPALPTFAGGSGTTASPYLIATVDQLNSIGSNIRLLDKHFRLANDLNMAGVSFTMIAPNPYIFTGSFDGAGNSISGLKIEPEFDLCTAGFIGIGEGATVKNLTLRDPNVTAEMGWSVGSLIGRIRGGRVSNCQSFNVDVKGLTSTGGLVGTCQWYGIITDSGANGRVWEDPNSDFFVLSPIGGLVGELTYYSEIYNSYAKCNVIGGDYVSGFVGSAFVSAKIINCGVQGNVSATKDIVAGLVGRSNGANKIEYCYSGAKVTGPLSNPSVAAFVSSTSSSGYTFTSCFWDTTKNPGLSGLAEKTHTEVIGETTANLKSKSTYLAKGWDFTTMWTVCENSGYPSHIWAKLLGDVTCPEGVSFSDFALIAREWMKTDCAARSNCYGADLDLSGAVNTSDLYDFALNWLQGTN